MTNLFSNLKFTHLKIENTLPQDSPNIVYRYFKNEQDRKNFLNGNIWFAGVSQLRFFLDHPDIWEYRSEKGSVLFQYSLSCSLQILDSSRPTIKIIDIKGFIQEIINSIENDNLTHIVSWFTIKDINKKKELMKKSGKECKRSISEFPFIFDRREHPIKENETVTLAVQDVGGRVVEYTRKSKGLSSVDKPLEAIADSLNVNDEFEGEDEFRIFLNSGDFINSYSGKNLQQLVEYLKITCPNIKKFCELIN